VFTPSRFAQDLHRIFPAGIAYFILAPIWSLPSLSAVFPWGREIYIYTVYFDFQARRMLTSDTLNNSPRMTNASYYSNGT